MRAGVGFCKHVQSLCTAKAMSGRVDVDGVDHLEVVDVDPDSQDLAVVEGLGEDAVVGVVELLEVLLEEPVEELALEATAGLLDSVDGLDDAGDERLAVGAELHVPLGLAAVDHLAVEERALEVGSDEVDAADAAAMAGGEGEEGAS
jgi:hypothetical protein